MLSHLPVDRSRTSLDLNVVLIPFLMNVIMEEVPISLTTGDKVCQPVHLSASGVDAVELASMTALTSLYITDWLSVFTSHFALRTSHKRVEGLHRLGRLVLDIWSVKLVGMTPHEMDLLLRPPLSSKALSTPVYSSSFTYYLISHIIFLFYLRYAQRQHTDTSGNIT